MNNNGIILFDGICNMCNAYVHFIIKRDPRFYFKFASLQSQKGKELLKQYNLTGRTFDSIVLIENGRAYTHSSVPLRVVKQLHFFWPLLFIFILVPPFFRNAIYRLVAKNRYQWFGKKATCMLPTSNIKSRFL